MHPARGGEGRGGEGRAACSSSPSAGGTALAVEGEHDAAADPLLRDGRGAAGRHQVRQLLDALQPTFVECDGGGGAVTAR